MCNATSKHEIIINRIVPLYFDVFFLKLWFIVFKLWQYCFKTKVSASCRGALLLICWTNGNTPWRLKASFQLQNSQCKLSHWLVTPMDRQYQILRPHREHIFIQRRIRLQQLFSQPFEHSWYYILSFITMLLLRL
jgi:hypothetical protein